MIPAASLLRWPTVRLGEVAQVAGGIQKSPDRSPSNLHRPYVTVRNVQRGWLDLSHVERFEVTEAEIERLRLRTDDLLIVEGNGSLDQVGRSALFQHPNDGQEWIHQNHVIRVRLDANVILPAFAALFLRSPAGAAQLLERARTTSGLYTLSVGKVESLLVPKPDRGMQQEIVKRLSAQRAVVERARAAAEVQLEAARRLRAAYLNGTFGREGGRWPVKTLRDVCKAHGQYGLSEKSNSGGPGIPILGMANLGEGRIRSEATGVVQLSDGEIDKYRLEDGDVLFNRTNSAELVGKTAVFKGRRQAVFASYLIRFRIDSEQAEPEFISAYINSNDGRDFIRRNMARAIGQVNISASAMHRMPTPMPPLIEQARLVKVLNARLEVVNQMEQTIRAQLNALEALPAALLRLAFAG